LLLSTGFDCDLKLWEIEDSKKISFDDDVGDITLTQIYSLKNSSSYITERPILCVCFHKEKIVFGDDGYNIKLIDLAEGILFIC